MVVVRAAFDSSLDHPAGTTVVAGYIADADQWQTVETQWNQLLFLNGMDSFHLKEMKHRFGSRWLDVVSQFATLIGRSGLRSIYALLRDTDWSQVVRDPAHIALLPRREHVCLDMMFESLALTQELDFNNEPIAAVFDNDWDSPQRIGESVLKIHNAWCERQDRPGFNLFFKGGALWGAIPLQTADLLAGLLRMNKLSQGMLDQTMRGLDDSGQLAEVTRAAMVSGRGSMWSKAVAKKVEETLRKLKK